MKVKVRKPSEVLNELKGKTVGFDIETANLAINKPVTMISIYEPQTNVAYVLPTKTVQYTVDDKERESLKELLESLKVITHNGQYDGSHLFYELGVCPQIVFDTYVFANMIQWKDSKKLKDMFYQVCGGEEPTYFEDVLEIPSDGSDIQYDLRTPNLIKYSALDAVKVWKLAEELSKLKSYQSMKAIISLEMKFYSNTCKMRARGLKVNETEYNSQLEVAYQEYDKLLQELYDMVGHRVRIDSPKEMQELLFVELGLTPYLKTKTGAPSTNAQALAYHEGNPVVDKIKECKEMGAFIKGGKKAPNFIINEHFHPEFMNVGDDGTGRVYTRNTSVNQLPRPTRKAIIPNNPNNKFVYFDLSSAELFIAAMWAKCDAITEPYKNKQDVHTMCAKLLMGKDEITKEERNISKILSFGTIYGSTGAAASRALRISQQEGEDLVKLYLETFHEIKELRDKFHSMVLKTGHTKTYLGRLRHLDKAFSFAQQDKEKACRQAFNTAIQGSCADIFKLIVNRIFKEFPQVECNFGVFDSFLIEVPKTMSNEEIVQMCERLTDFNEIMEGLKFNYEVGVGETWLDAQENSVSPEVFLK